MRQRRAAFHLVWVGLLCAMAAAATASIGSQSGTPATASIESRQGAVPEDPAVCVPDADPGVPPASDDITPMACKKEPQCATDSDCVVWCGPSGGHCVHSSCPIRICKCS